MNLVRGFPPISGPDATTLVLGSMPSRESLARRQYYAHPRNGFWPIITALLESEPGTYDKQVARVTSRGIAIWDVLQACIRPGSLDSAIDEQSVVPNDFRRFFAAHPHIRRVFFNGAKAEALYRKHVLPGLSGPAAALALQRLPSTSPAHAGMSLAQKMTAWRVLLDGVE
jgi:hypoxanthine-DNA glycosylase